MTRPRPREEATVWACPGCGSTRLSRSTTRSSSSSSVRGGGKPGSCTSAVSPTAGDVESDGLIPFGALPFVHGRKRDAELLVAHGLWKPHPRGWEVVNWAERQPSSATLKQSRTDRSIKAPEGELRPLAQAGLHLLAGRGGHRPEPPRTRPVRPTRIRLDIRNGVRSGSESDRTDVRTYVDTYKTKSIMSPT
jgi:hypothetical protein